MMHVQLRIQNDQGDLASEASRQQLFGAFCLGVRTLHFWVFHETTESKIFSSGAESNRMVISITSYPPSHEHGKLTQGIFKRKTPLPGTLPLLCLLEGNWDDPEVNASLSVESSCAVGLGSCQLGRLFPDVRQPHVARSLFSWFCSLLVGGCNKTPFLATMPRVVKPCPRESSFSGSFRERTKWALALAVGSGF